MSFVTNKGSIQGDVTIVTGGGGTGQLTCTQANTPVVATLAGNLTFNPAGTGVLLASGKELQTAAGNLVFNPVGTGVVLASGKELQTAVGNLVLNPTGTGVVVASGKQLQTAAGNLVLNPTGSSVELLTGKSITTTSGALVISPAGGANVQIPNLDVTTTADFTGVAVTGLNALEVISTNTAITTSGTTVFDSRAGALSVTLANGTDNNIKHVKLLYAHSSAVNIACLQGNICLTPTENSKTLLYTNGSWHVINSNTGSSNLFPMTQQQKIATTADFTGAVGIDPSQGSAVALSADGNTLAIGAPNDNPNIGAVWVFTRTAGVWTIQGTKLVGTGATGGAAQGTSVALSADGNTLAIGGPTDDSSAGAVWVFLRTAGVWAQQGLKLVGTGATGSAVQGTSVALSSDGNTLLSCGPDNNANVGAAWVFTRSAGVWSQQAGPLVGTGATGTSRQGNSCCISADGNMALIGATQDNSSVGACWVFRRATSWSQETKIVPVGATGSSGFGSSVSTASSGDIIAVGGRLNASSVGAVWVYMFINLNWELLAGPIVGSSAVGTSEQGSSVALSSDGNTLVVGGPGDTSNAGATWTFLRSGTGYIQKSKLVGTGAIQTDARQGASVALNSNGDTLAVGAPEDDNSPGTGAVWVFV